MAIGKTKKKKERTLVELQRGGAYDTSGKKPLVRKSSSQKAQARKFDAKQQKIHGAKTAGNLVLKYREMLAAGETEKIPALEELSKYVTRKGTIKKRETRYNTGKERFNEALKNAKDAMQSEHPGKKNIKEYNRKQRERFKKATETYTERNAEHKTKSGKRDKRFMKNARKVAAAYVNAVNVFASNTYEDLVSKAFGVGSNVVVELANEGLSDDDIETYLKQVMESFNDIPTEARGLVGADEFWKSTVNIIKLINDEGDIDFKDVLNAYIDTAPDPEQFSGALANYVANGDYSKSFSEVWSDLQYTMEPDNMDNLQELFDEGDEESE